MVIDTSALIAVLFDEPLGDAPLRTIAAAERRLVSCGSVLEATMVVEGRLGEAAGRDFGLFLHRASIQTVAIDADQTEIARAAWRRHGKGRHPAGLDYGDLFSYALAPAIGEELLFVGDDFARTDIARAPLV